MPDKPERKSTPPTPPAAKGKPAAAGPAAAARSRSHGELLAHSARLVERSQQLSREMLELASRIAEQRAIAADAAARARDKRAE